MHRILPYRRQPSPVLPPRLEDTDFPRREVTYGEEDSGEVLMANQTFVSDVVALSPFDPSPNTSFNNRNHTTATTTIRRGLQEDEEEDVSLPARHRRNASRERNSSRNSSSYRRRRRGSTGAPTTTIANDTTTTPSTSTSQEQPRRRNRIADFLSRGSTHSAPPAVEGNAEQNDEERGRGRRRRRRRQRRRDSDQQQQEDDDDDDDELNALELHPRLQQALLDRYWEKRERKMIAAAALISHDPSTVGQDDDSNWQDETSISLKQFLVQQGVAMDSILKKVNAAELEQALAVSSRTVAPTPPTRAASATRLGSSSSFVANNTTPKTSDNTPQRGNIRQPRSVSNDTTPFSEQESSQGHQPPPYFPAALPEKQLASTAAKPQERSSSEEKKKPPAAMLKKPPPTSSIPETNLQPPNQKISSLESDGPSYHLSDDDIPTGPIQTKDRKLPAKPTSGQSAWEELLFNAPGSPQPNEKMPQSSLVLQPRRSVSDITMQWELMQRPLSLVHPSKQRRSKSMVSSSTTSASLDPQQQLRDSKTTTTSVAPPDVPLISSYTLNDSRSTTAFITPDISVNTGETQSNEDETDDDGMDEGQENQYFADQNDYMDDEQLKVWIQQIEQANPKMTSIREDEVEHAGTPRKSVGNEMTKDHDKNQKVQDFLLQQADAYDRKMAMNEKPKSTQQKQAASTAVGSKEDKFAAFMHKQTVALENERQKAHDKASQSSKQQPKGAKKAPPGRVSTRSLGLQDDDDDMSLSSLLGPRSKSSENPSRTVAKRSPSIASSTGIHTKFQCQCCYETKDTKDQGLACDNYMEMPHMFCSDCVRRYLWSATQELSDTKVANRLGDKLCQIPCMCQDGKGCRGLVHINLEKIWSRREWDQWNEQRKVRMDRQQAASSQPVEAQGSDTVGKAMSKGLEQIQIAMKEALTKVRVRSCPKCRQAFVKNDDGCNKMKCPACKTCSCYMCRQIIPTKGYDHFDNTTAIKDVTTAVKPASGNCPLWSNEAVDQVWDEDDMRNVLMDLANKVWEEYLSADVLSTDASNDDSGMFSESSLTSSIADVLARLPPSASGGSAKKYRGK